MLKLALAFLPIALCCPASRADNCEPIRAQIESKIRAAGVVDFSVTAVDSSASAAGKIVGSCASGTMKIVYARGDERGKVSPPPVAPSKSAASTSKGSNAAILTECKDGTVSMGGDCKK
jgi:Protein of unknown function (DUF1161)